MMKVRVQKISELLGDMLSLTERGLLITMILLRDDDPKLTLAKVKAKVRVSEVRKEMIHLQELGLIEWSGYKKAVEALHKEKITPELLEIVDFMNQTWGRDFKPDSKSTTTNLIQRMSENSVDDIKLVIANRYAEWGDDPLMHKYLSPTTVFRPSKFDKYLEEAKRTKSGESLVNACKINLKKGDTITWGIVQEFTDDDVYVVRTFPLKGNQPRGRGKVEKLYGKDLKRRIRFVQNNIDAGRSADEIYIYEGR